MISKNRLPGWPRTTIWVTNFMKSLGHIEWVVDVGVAVGAAVVLCLLVIVLVALARPK